MARRKVYMMAGSRCIYLNVPPDADGVKRVRSNWAYRCEFPVPEYPLPVSVTRYYDFKWPPIKSQVIAPECQKCPCFTAKAEPVGDWLL
jgi:2-methylisocitrate lyase-like PEP mutase family enzyme